MKKIVVENKKEIIKSNTDLVLDLQNDKSGKVIVEVPNKADIKIVSIVHAQKQESYELDYKIIHKFPFTHSNSIFKAVLEGASSYNFKGLIEIENGASNSNSYLKVDILILSNEARANVVPSLEIKENEIQASHGATITKINEDQVFYMQTRGISKKKSKNLIVEGFLKPE